MKLLHGVALGLVATAASLAACGSSDLVVGDDSREDAERATEGGVLPDASRPEADAASDGEQDAPPDALPGTCAGMPNDPGLCLPTGSDCTKADTTGRTCPQGTFCCAVSCPELAQPPPGFCDGGPYAPLYGANGCIVGFGCPPITCANAGGTCVGLAPGSCPSNHVGNASTYACGGGVGVMCCLP